MATISSHVLDSVKGSHAAGIRCQLLQLSANGERQVLFDVLADHEGRINETLHLGDDDLGREYELLLHAAEYFQVDTALIPVVVIRFIVHDADKRYHLPVMLSPHSYSSWWSS
jgi:5-hydroxyisourate hydrolase